MIYWLWRLGLALVRRVPIGLAYAGATAAADVAWLAMPVHRANAIENMERVAGPGRRRLARTLAHRSFRNYAKYVADFMRHPRIEGSEMLAKVEFDDWGAIDAVLARGKGCIWVLMHFGNWDIGAAALAIRGYPINAIAETQGHSRLNDDLVAARTVRGMKLIPMERAATGIVRAMRRNETLAILIDRPLSEGGVDVKFFGAATQVPAGPARIALRTGAKLVPVALVRIAGHDDRIRAILDFDVEPLRSGDDERDVQALTQQVMAAHERFIRRFPDQWYMFRRMWPEQPRRAGRAASARSQA